MTRTGEQGIALVFTLFLMGALSAMAVSMMFLAQTETSASRNYKTMSQARYAGEAGVQRVLHYLSSTAYSDLVTSVAGLDITVSPVTYNGNPVVLTPVAASSNHPTQAIKDAYAALFANTAMSVGSGATVTYTATATLLSARLVTVYGGVPQVVQTWRINATGTVPPACPTCEGADLLRANVEVAAVLERDSAPAETYAIFATGAGCGAIELSGNVATDSFDYNEYVASGATGEPATQTSGGSIGTNGNVTGTGRLTINGNLDTPRSGVGNCSNGNVPAVTLSGGATINGDRLRLPQPKTYPTPTAPVPVPGTGTLNISTSTSCTSLSLAFMLPTFGTTCSGSGGNLIITTNGQTIVWPNVEMEAGTSITFNAGPGQTASKINVNSFAMEGGATINVGADTSILMNARGYNLGTNQAVIDFTGGSLVNGTGSAAYDASRFQILYAGTGTIKIGGSTDTAATIYAPNATVDMNGSADFYGSILSTKFKDNGGASVHYDRSLKQRFSTLGQYVLSSFSWQKY